jgi:dolichol-phosphate mannosyltransferase
VFDSLVIIPTYNEKENIEDIIRAVISLDEDFDILVVDDNSPDGTADIVKSLQQEFKDIVHLLVRKEKSGLGTAYIAGFKYGLSKGYAYLFEMDADFSHKPVDLVRLRKECRDGNADLCVGSRYVEGGGVVNWPWDRLFLSKGASYYVQAITWMPVKDSTGGFKCYTRRVLESINLEKIEFVGYAFQIEMKYAAWSLGFNIKEIPIIFEDRVKGVSKMNLSIVSEAILGVLKMRFSKLLSADKYKNV